MGNQQRKEMKMRRSPLGSVRYRVAELTHDLDAGLSEECYLKIPTRMLPMLYDYVIKGVRPGHFLQAVSTNDLAMAIHYADEKNGNLLREWVGVFYHHVPSACWGSRDRMESWVCARSSEYERECEALKKATHQK